MSSGDTGTGGHAGTWRIGDLARATGVSVRSLRHYDAVGLLAPSGRTNAGHRFYTTSDVRRLHRIVALRSLGLGLAEVRQVLADSGTGAGVVDLLRHQLDQVEQRIAAQRHLRRRLVDVLDALGERAEPPVPDILDLIEGTTAVDRRLTREELDRMNEARRTAMEQLSPQQREELAARRRAYREQLSEEDLAEMRRRRAALLPLD